MKNAFVLLLVMMLFASCGKESIIENGLLTQEVQVSEGVIQNQDFVTNGFRRSGTSFRVRIEVINEGNFATPFAPGVWLLQNQRFTPLFAAGRPDFGDGLEALAEDGSPGPLNAALAANPLVRDHGVFNTPVGASGPGPIFPGDAYEFTFSGNAGDYLNFATMFIQSNDLFVGPSSRGIALFDRRGNPISGDITSRLALWDAGTEVNERPGVGPNQAPRQSGPDTGETENGNVRVVDDGYVYPAVDEVVRVTITPL